MPNSNHNNHPLHHRSHFPGTLTCIFLSLTACGASSAEAAVFCRCSKRPVKREDPG
ncbi:hypothetical protein L209DRAFT_730285 [Thermothelomyces heterothallicus CBS 203.75]